MAGLDSAPPDTVGVNGVISTLLTDRAQVQVVLVELPDQLTHIDAQPLLELAVGQAPGFLLAQERAELLEAVTARGERSHSRLDLLRDLGALEGGGLSGVGAAGRHRGLLLLGGFEIGSLQCARCRIENGGHPPLTTGDEG